jgi:hypothetical protein
MALVNMARSKEEVKKETKEMQSGLDAPMYPWGLTLRLDEETLAKLGMAIPESGAQMTVNAVATVTSVSSRQEIDGETCSNVELQITELDITPTQGTSKATQANSLYGDDD